jgi:hypothetical protein
MDVLLEYMGLVNEVLDMRWEVNRRIRALTERARPSLRRGKLYVTLHPSWVTLRYRGREGTTSYLINEEGIEVISPSKLGIEKVDSLPEEVERYVKGLEEKIKGELDGLRAVKEVLASVLAILRLVT